MAEINVELSVLPKIEVTQSSKAPIHVTLSQVSGSSSDPLRLRSEIESLFKVAQSTKYTEFGYLGGDLVSIDIWDSVSKGVKLFTKTINYSSGNISDITIQDEVESQTLVKTFTYVSGDIATKTESIT